MTPTPAAPTPGTPPQASRWPAILREPSTWRGVALALSLAGVTNGAELAEVLGALVIAGLAAWEMLRKQLPR